jgi:hypothetical protein
MRGFANAGIVALSRRRAQGQLESVANACVQEDPALTEALLKSEGWSPTHQSTPSSVLHRQQQYMNYLTTRERRRRSNGLMAAAHQAPGRSINFQVEPQYITPGKYIISLKEKNDASALRICTDRVFERNKSHLFSKLKDARRHLPHYSLRMYITRSERVADLLDWRTLHSHLVPIERFANTGTADAACRLRKQSSRLRCPRTTCHIRSSNVAERERQGRS